MNKSYNLSRPLIRILITIGILCTLFVLSVGDSAWLSLMILFGIAIVGLLTGVIICDVNQRLH